MKTGIELISEERKEQIEKHGYSSNHDDEINSDGQLIRAAWYALTFDDDAYPENWNHGFKAKVLDKPKTERLAIVGALIAAEIDRLQRQKQQ